MSKTNWAALIPAIEAFFDSDEVQGIESSTLNLLVNGRMADPVAIGKLQARLHLLRELKTLAQRCAKLEHDREQKQAEEEFQKQRAVGGRFIRLPRID